MEITRGDAGAARRPSYVRLGNGWSTCRAEWLRKPRAIVQIYLARLIGMHIGDLGYTNRPTEIVLFQEVELLEHRMLKLILRMHIEHVAYPHIAQTLS